MKSNVLLPLMLLGTSSCVASSSAEKLPNVLFILVDDMGYGDLGCYGQQRFETPNIDALAQSGMMFTQGYAGSAVSSPSRATLMTGQDTGHTYIRENSWSPVDIDGRRYDIQLPDEAITVAELFKERGYSTACIGKWGMGGPNGEGSPNNQGFDYFYGYLCQMVAHNYFPEYIHENRTEVKLGEKEYSHELFEQRSLNYIKEHKDDPFFLYLTFTIPHAELRLPEEDMCKYKGIFEETEYKRITTYSAQKYPRAAFASMIERLDLSVGRINSLLEELDIDDNTLVIFTSDNGAHREGGADPEFFNSTGGLRGYKGDLYEGGIRVPFIAKWSGQIPSGSKNDTPIAFWDMMPTLAELIGLDRPEFSNGVSHLDTFRGGKSPKRDGLYWEIRRGGGMKVFRDGDWKLIQLNATNPEKSYYELYNINDDSAETNNVIADHLKRAEKMKVKLAKSRTFSEHFDF